MDRREFVKFAGIGVVGCLLGASLVKAAKPKQRIHPMWEVFEEYTLEDFKDAMIADGVHIQLRTADATFVPLATCSQEYHIARNQCKPRHGVAFFQNYMLERVQKDLNKYNESHIVGFIARKGDKQLQDLIMIKVVL